MRLAWYRPSISNPALGLKSPIDWGLQIQVQVSPLYLSRQYFAEVSGCSAWCKHVRNWCLDGSPQWPSQVRTLAGVCPVSSLSSLANMSEGKRTALAYPSYWFISQLKNIYISKQYGSVSKMLRKRWTVTYNPASLIQPRCNLLLFLARKECFFCMLVITECV